MHTTPGNGNAVEVQDREGHVRRRHVQVLHEGLVGSVLVVERDLRVLARLLFGALLDGNGVHVAQRRRSVIVVGGADDNATVFRCLAAGGRRGKQQGAAQDFRRE